MVGRQDERGAYCFHNYGPADASALPKPHNLLPHLVVVVVVVAAAAAAAAVAVAVVVVVVVVAVAAVVVVVVVVVVAVAVVAAVVVISFNPPVLKWRCRLTQVDVYSGRKTVVVVDLS